MFNLTSLKVDFALGVIVVSVILIALYVHRQTPPSQTNTIDGLGITELVNKVKADLVRAENDGTAKMFIVKTFDLEINFVVKARQSESGEIKYEVVTLGAENETSTEKVQKITLHMETEQQIRDTKPEKEPMTNPHTQENK